MNRRPMSFQRLDAREKDRQYIYMVSTLFFYFNSSNQFLINRCQSSLFLCLRLRLQRLELQPVCFISLLISSWAYFGYFRSSRNRRLKLCLRHCQNRLQPRFFLFVLFIFILGSLTDRFILDSPGCQKCKATAVCFLASSVTFDID